MISEERETKVKVALGAGHSQRRAAILAGVSRGTVSKIILGNRERRVKTLKTCPICSREFWAGLKQARCNSCKRDKRARYSRSPDPTPEEIAERAAEIRAKHGMTIHCGGR